MKKYAVEILETLSKIIFVEAENDTKAVNQVKDHYRNGEITLDRVNNYFDTEFQVHFAEESD